MSVSRVDVPVTVRGKGSLTVGLYKHMAPVTVQAVLDELPISSRAMVYSGAMVTLLTKLKVGVEKQRLEYSKGDVAFLAANGSICIFLANAQSQRPLNPIGRVEEGSEILEKVSAGDVVELSRPAQTSQTAAAVG
jgi:hypothetical protein